MKAAVYYGPGDVRIEDVREPEPPGPAEVVIQVKMGSLCGTDASQYKAATMVPLDGPHRVSGHSGPVILGHEVVGVVVARGSEVTHLEIGQRVVPGAGWWCGECPRCKEGRINICENYYLYGIHANGGLAEFARFPAQMSMPVPPECSDEAAAMAQPCAVALHALARGRIAIDQTVAASGIYSWPPYRLRLRVDSESSPSMLSRAGSLPPSGWARSPRSTPVRMIQLPPLSS